jgi:pimeloyl-ACP methyl ester carboxylesterase
MVHGHARSAPFWSRWVPWLAQDRRVYRLELRGCGSSDPPPKGHQFTAEGILQDIKAAMDGIGLERVHWIGESSSGVLGLAFAATFPERIASLTLCDTPYKIPDDLKPSYQLGHATTADAIEAVGTREWCRRTLQNRLDLDRSSAEMKAWYIETMGKTPGDIAASYNRCFEAADLRPILNKVQAPTLLLGGDKSPISAKQLATLAKDVPNARTHVFPGYGHGVSVLAPEECAEAALRFWEELER